MRDVGTCSSRPWPNLSCAAVYWRSTLYLGVCRSAAGLRQLARLHATNTVCSLGQSSRTSLSMQGFSVGTARERWVNPTHPAPSSRAIQPTGLWRTHSRAAEEGSTLEESSNHADTAAAGASAAAAAQEAAARAAAAAEEAAVAAAAAAAGAKPCSEPVVSLPENIQDLNQRTQQCMK